MQGPVGLGHLVPSGGLLPLPQGVAGVGAASFFVSMLVISWMGSVVRRVWEAGRRKKRAGQGLPVSPPRVDGLPYVGSAVALGVGHGSFITRCVVRAEIAAPTGPRAAR